MGISLKDLSNIVVGGIERDRELTRENLAIRAEELKANRDLLIRQKEKKYDRELEQFYKEKEKFDTINQANEMYNKKSIDARTYAATILPLTNPNWKNLDDKTKERDISNFEGKTIDYKLVGNADEIQKQAANINTEINKVTAEEIKNAKGDSFLINKILGKKAQAEKDLLEEVESKIKAADSVKMSEQNVNQEYVGKDVNVSSSTSAFSNDPNSDKYQEYWDKHRLKINMDIDGTKGLRFFNTVAIAGGSDGLSFKYDKTDSKITGMNAPSIAYVEAARHMFNTIKDSDDEMIYHYNNVTNLFGNIGKTWNEENIFKKMEKEIPNRAGNIKQGFGNPLVSDIRLTTVVPLSIVPLGTKFINKETNTDETKQNLKTISNVMNDYIIKKTKVLEKSGNYKDRNAQQIATMIYQGIYQDDGYYSTELKNILFKNNEPIKVAETNNTSLEESTTTPPPPSPKYTVTKSNGKEGLAINGKFKSWEEIEAADAVNDLPKEQKENYNTWKNKQSMSSDILDSNSMA